jgi:hypothetical protein
MRHSLRLQTHFLQKNGQDCPTLCKKTLITSFILTLNNKKLVKMDIHLSKFRNNESMVARWYTYLHTNNFELLIKHTL